MSESSKVRVPCIEEYDPHKQLLLNILKSIRRYFINDKEFQVGWPLNICLYTAFPSFNWGFGSGGRFFIENEDEKWISCREIKMNIWVLNDPNIDFLKDKVQQPELKLIEYSTLILRTIMVTGHWKICPFTVSSDNEGIHSIFGFSYPTCEGMLEDRLKFITDNIPTEDQILCKWKDIDIFRPPNELDDFVLTGQKELTKNDLSLLFTRIPYLSVPIVFLAFPRKDEALGRAILWRATRQIQPTLALYSQSLIRGLLNAIARKVKTNYWSSNLNMVIPVVVGMAVASALLPLRVDVYSQQCGSAPCLTISLDEEQLPYKHCGTREESIPLIGKRIGECELKITFLDHHNPYLDAAINPEEILDGRKQIQLASTYPYYQDQLDLFKTFLKMEVDYLEYYAKLREAEQTLTFLQGIGKSFEDQTRMLIKSLNALERLQSTEFSIITDAFRWLKQQVLRLAKEEGKDRIIKSFTALGNNGGEKFKEFLNMLNRHFENHKAQHNGHIKHILEEAEPKLTKLLSEGLREILNNFLAKIIFSLYGSQGLVDEFQKWLCHCVELHKKDNGNTYNWPLIIPPDGQIAQDVLVKALESAMPGYHVEVNNHAKGVSETSIDIPVLCYISDSLFKSKEGRYPNDGKVRAHYEKDRYTWNLSWNTNTRNSPIINFNEIADSALDQEDKKAGEFLVPDRLRNRLWLLRECFGTIEGQISIDNEGTAKLEWMSK